MPDFSFLQWVLLIVATAGIGVSKSGFAGVGIVHVLLFAMLFGARQSTGVVLPMLLTGDVCAVAGFRQHARWEYIWRMLPPACIGVVAAATAMRRLDEGAYKPIIGGIILALAVMQAMRMVRPDWLGSVPHSRAFAWTMGLVAGAATMLANAAGPIFAVYALALGLPKYEYAGTSAWFFLLINTFKVPFSIGLGLIHASTLLLNLTLSPVIVLGMVAGRWLIKRVPQRLFDALLLAFAVIAALRLMGAL